jgi:hypothetical protein
VLDPSRPYHPWNGSLAEVRLWSRALLTGEIRGGMHHLLSGDEPGLIGRWGFDHQTGQDRSPTAHHATFTSGVSFSDDLVDLEPHDQPRAGWHAHKLNAPGKFLLWSPDHDIPRRARAYLITDDDVTDAVTRYAPARPPLDPISRRALAATPSATAQPGDAEGGNDADAGQPEDPEDDPESILRTALSRAPEEGVSVPDLVAATGMSRR